ncbi:hypothetical protein BYT27DRAFT_7342204 [Phlegmacium glaucopus]|nr:hypothetical protein BYT27DRAFT_7342204 [Phlegmacium glaucopus]
MGDKLTVNVIVDPQTLSILHEGNYSLCLARDLRFGSQEMKGNVVSSIVPAREVSPRMTLGLEDRYQVYETVRFDPGAQVQPATATADIVGGQTVRFDETGSPDITGVPRPGQPFSVQNDFRQGYCIGVNNYDISSQSFTSFFISPPVPVRWTSELLPIKRFSVFWNSNLAINTMFDPAAINAFTFDIDNSDITLQYKDGAWSIVQ